MEKRLAPNPKCTEADLRAGQENAPSKWLDVPRSQNLLAALQRRLPLLGWPPSSPKAEKATLDAGRSPWDSLTWQSCRGGLTWCQPHGGEVSHVGSSGRKAMKGLAWKRGLEMCGGGGALCMCHRPVWHRRPSPELEAAADKTQSAVGTSPWERQDGDERLTRRNLSPFPKNASRRYEAESFLGNYVANPWNKWIKESCLRAGFVPFPETRLETSRTAHTCVPTECVLLLSQRQPGPGKFAKGCWCRASFEKGFVRNSRLKWTLQPSGGWLKSQSCFGETRPPFSVLA